MHKEYREYQENLIGYKNWWIVIFTILSIPLVLFGWVINLNLAWTYYFMGVLISSSVFPIGLSITWARVSSRGILSKIKDCFAWALQQSYITHTIYFFQNGPLLFLYFCFLIVYFKQMFFTKEHADGCSCFQTSVVESNLSTNCASTTTLTLHGLVVMFRRLWVRIVASFTGWTFICCKKINVCSKRRK